MTDQPPEEEQKPMSVGQWWVEFKTLGWHWFLLGMSAGVFITSVFVRLNASGS